MSLGEIYNRFCDQRFGLPTQVQLSQIEKKIKTRLPDDYRNFVLQYNGGYFNEPWIDVSVAHTVGGTDDIEECPKDGLRSLSGIGAPHSFAELASDGDLSMFNEPLPPKWLPIGNTSRNHLLLLVARGPEKGVIYLKEAFASNVFCLASGIDGLFRLLRSDEEYEELNGP